MKKIILFFAVAAVFAACAPKAETAEEVVAPEVVEEVVVEEVPADTTVVEVVAE